MGAQRPGHQIGAAAAQSLLEQAVGQQVGGDHDAARAPASGVGDRVAHIVGLPVAANPRSTRDPVSADSNVAAWSQVGARPSIRGARRRKNHRIAGMPAGFHQLLSDDPRDLRARPQRGCNGDIGMSAGRDVGRQIGADVISARQERRHHDCGL